MLSPVGFFFFFLSYAQGGSLEFGLMAAHPDSMRVVFCAPWRWLKNFYLIVAVGWPWTLAWLDSSPRPIHSRSHTRCCSLMHQLLILLVLQSERGNGSLCKYPRHELILRIAVQCLIIPFHIDNGVIFLYHVIGIFLWSYSFQVI